MSYARELFLSAAPVFPDDNTGDYLDDDENNDEFSKVGSEERGDDEAESKRGWNHEGREGPKLSAGAGDERVAIEKHNRLKVMFDSSRAKWLTGGLPLMDCQSCGAIRPPGYKPLVCQCVFADKTAGKQWTS